MAGKAASYATDPGWERGVAQVYSGLSGQGAFPQIPGGGPPSPGPASGVNIGKLMRQQFVQGRFSLDSLTHLRRQALAQSSSPAPSPGVATPPAGETMPAASVGKWVTKAGSADRAGVPTNPAVLGFAAKIGRIYGQPLTIGTGSNHREYVNNDPHGHQSDHWFGEAADIPAAGDQLTRLGQDSLIAAGMPAAQARKQTGGVYNIGGYNILFNTHVGGNHFNHLHIGLGRILGRHF
jgi:hypothetical protein